MWNENEAWQAAMAEAVASCMANMPREAVSPEELAKEGVRSVVEVLAWHPALSEVQATVGQWHLWCVDSGYPCATTR